MNRKRKANQGTTKTKQTSSNSNPENKRTKQTTNNSSAQKKRMKVTSSLTLATNKITRELFNQSTYDLANFLLGKFLVRKLEDGNILKGRIVETESYPGGEDKASSTHGNRRTPAVEPLYMQPGTTLVYMTYGMYHCINISSAEPGGGVLLRAVEPILGIDKMQEFRMKNRKSKAPKELKENELCNGPSKLCTSMDIRKNDCNAMDLCESDVLWLESDLDFKDKLQTIKTTRIGIDRAPAEWVKMPFRFYVLGSSSISKRDPKAEENFSK